MLIANDALIAGILNRNDLKTGNGNRWTRERVTSLRSHYRIPVFCAAADGVEPWLNLGDAAKLLKVAPKTLRLAAEAGEIEAIHPLPEGPWTICPRRIGCANSPINHRTRAPEPQIPHRIGSGAANSLLFNHIDRWVFDCAVVKIYPAAWRRLKGQNQLPKSHQRGQRRNRSRVRNQIRRLIHPVT